MKQKSLPAYGRFGASLTLLTKMEAHARTLDKLNKWTYRTGGQEDTGEAHGMEGGLLEL